MLLQLLAGTANCVEPVAEVADTGKSGLNSCGKCLCKRRSLEFVNSWENAGLRLDSK